MIWTIYIMFIKQKISVCRCACLFVCLFVWVSNCWQDYIVSWQQTQYDLSHDVCILKETCLFINLKSIMKWIPSCACNCDDIVHSCKYENTHTHHICIYIYNYIWSYPMAGKYILSIGSFDYYIYVYIQGCGNSEPIAGHFGLFSLLLSCSPYTLCTV